MPERVPELDVAHVARLARLDLTADEHVLFSRQLADVVRYARQVQAVETAGVPLTTYPRAFGPLEREDVERPSLPADQALANAPERSPDGTLFRVPRVI